MFHSLLKKFSGTQLIALGFFLLIMMGTLLLMLPFAARDRSWTPFLSALFTATSATCVTGLTVVDTYLHWSLFGQLVILGLIQIGGLGFITLGVAFSMLLRRKIGLSGRGLIKESFSAFDYNGIVRLVRGILFGTAILEGTGAILLSIRFVPRMGIIRGIYYGVFHSISAFCNAGFDLMSYFGESSLCGYYDDPIVVLTICGLITIGGIGFIVWRDLKESGLHFKKYSLQTKIVLTGTLILVVGGTILFYIFEKNALFADMTLDGQILAALFSSVTPRTAGFNTVDITALSDSSKLLTMILMFIGGCSGSTAGGIKVTTAFVLLMYLRATLLRFRSCHIFGRRIDEKTVIKAASVFCTNLLLALIAALIISYNSDLVLTDIMFEVFSAIGTVGMSVGVSREVGALCQIVLVLLMYSGRLGSLTFALSFTDKKKVSSSELPVERVAVG